MPLQRIRIGPRRRRWLLALPLLLMGLPALALAAGIARMWPDPTPGVGARRGAIASIERSTEARGALLREDLRIVSTSGLEVEVAILHPPGDGPRPLLVLMVGHRTGKEAIELFDAIGERSVAAISYPYAGKHRLGLFEGLAAIPSIQDALLDTTPAALLALDALAHEPWIDAQRIEFIGVSLGALIGPKVAVLDGRYARVWLVHGAGDIVGLLAHQMRNRIGSERLRRGVAWAMASLLGAQHFAPERWSAHISPRPLMLLNALEDERMPLHCVEALHDSVGQPSEVVWLPGAHVRVARTEVVQDLARFLMQRIDDDPVTALERD